MAEAAKIATPHIVAVGIAVASVGDEIAGSVGGAQTVIKGYVNVERLTRDRSYLSLSK